MSQEEIDRALEYDKEFNELEKFFDQLDIDIFNQHYLNWMEIFEMLASPKAGFSENMDVDYNIVDALYEEGKDPKEAVTEYWIRKNIL